MPPTPESPHCPERHDTLQSTAEIMQGASQHIIERPKDIRDIIDDAQCQLKSIHGLMREHSPTRADVMLARRTRSIVRAVLGATVFSRMSEQLHNYTEGEERDVFINSATEMRTDYSTLRMTGKYHGAADVWMATMVNLHDESFFPYRTDSIDDQVLRCIETVSPTMYRELATAYAANGDNERACFWGKRTFFLDALHAGRENLTATFDAIVAAHIAIAKSGVVDTGNIHSVTEIMLANLEPMTRFASMNKSAIAKVLPDAHHSGIRDIFSRCGQDLARLAHVFTYRDGELLPNHASIAKAPWRQRGNCGGLARLRINDQETIGNVNAYAASLGVAGQDTQGRLQAVETLLKVGIDVGSYTILSSNKSPVVDHFNAA